MVNKVTPSVAPGAYPSAQTISWSFDPTVVEVAYTVNGLPPALSEYIAYDQLDPPNPFIAITQDGAGRVVYDGGFPKFYNSQAPAIDATFAELSGSFKYLYNALKFIANPTKVAGGNNKILVIGDKSDPVGNYCVKNTNPEGFFTSLTNICTIAGFVPTFKDIADYGAQITIALSELDLYCGVVFMSTQYDVGNDVLITPASVTDFTTYRAQGNGLIFITDHGTNVQTNIGLVTTVAGEGFYATANRIIVNFGAFFTGNYNRSPVNVGFIRSTYGDHPLYNGMDNAESIVAGASESKVVVQSATLIAPGAMPTTTLNPGTNQVRFLVKLADESVETYTFVYNIATGETILFKDSGGTSVSVVACGWNYRAKPTVELVAAGMGTLTGAIYHNTTKVGEVYFDEAGGTKAFWYAGEPVRVITGDTLRVDITSPFTYSRTISITRNTPADIYDLYALAKIVRNVFPYTSGVLRNRVIEKVVSDIGVFHPMVYGTSHAQNVYQVRNYTKGLIPHSDMNAYAYDTSAAVLDAISRLVPPTPQQIFNEWGRFEADNWYPNGVTPAGDAAAWYWDEALGTAVQPNNTPNYVGFISDYNVLDYDLEVTLTSTAGDDDWISVVLGFVRDPDTGQNHSLDLAICRCAKGYDTRTTWPNQLITTDFQFKNTWAAQTGRYKEYKAVVGEDTAGWSGAYKRVKVMRRGDLITIQATPWNSLVYNAAYSMSINLNDYPELALFKGAHPIGFGALSQAGATFKDIAFSDGYRRDVILDVLNNRIYRYFNGAWAPVTGPTLHDIFGAPRIVNAIEGNKRYQLNTNGTISLL
jgi:hypothetical protein